MIAVATTTLLLLSLATGVRAQPSSYDNCAVLSAAKQVRVEWTLRASDIDVRFSGLSSGYVCVGLYAADGPAFRTGGGHPRTDIDVWCAYGATLRDNFLEEEDVKEDDVNDLRNRAVESNGTHIVAQFRRRLAGRRGGDEYDHEILTDGTPQRLVWAIHPTDRDNGDRRHPRGPDRNNEANAGTFAINWGRPSQCDVEQDAGSFVSGAGDFELAFARDTDDPSLMQFTMEAETDGWLAFGWSDGTPAHQRADMYMAAGSGASCEVRDTWSTGKSAPATDASRDIVAGSESCTRANGRTVVSFKRAIDTGDSLTDLRILDKPVLLQWAYSTSSDMSERHQSTGTGYVNFLAAPGAAPVTAPPTPAPTPAPPPETTPTSLATDGGKYKLSWTVDGDSIEFTVEIASNGYAGFGWTSTDNSPHRNSDFIVVWVDNAGETTALDAFSKAKTRAPSDASNDVTVVSGEEANGKTTVTVRRKLDTGDAVGDVPITNEALLVQWCYHGADSYEQGDVHERFGTAIVNFLSDSPPMVVPPTPRPTNGNNGGGSGSGGGDMPGEKMPTPGLLVVGDGQLRLQWRLDATKQKLAFELECGTVGYCAVGIASDVGGGGHKQADMWLFWVDDLGEAHMRDAFSNSLEEPPADPSQDLETLSGAEDGGVSSFTFERLLDTGDAMHDVIIGDAPILVQWAVHGFDNLEYHDNFGTAVVNFLDENAAPVVDDSSKDLGASEGMGSDNGMGSDSGGGAAMGDGVNAPEEERGLGGLAIGLIILAVICFVLIIAAVVNALLIKKR